ncbi:hypothetical protein C8R47DRAFT_281389 [Mycena vitilis]|nr:hypothetical protein C8R47DRAFT_281389 [Mycena vitilis]
MIILDDQEQGSSKLAVPSATLRLPEPVAGRSASPLPDYETSQAQQTSAQVSAQAPVHSHPTFRKPSLPNHFNSRFWRVTFFALAIYVFLSVVIGIPVIVTRVAYRKSRSPPPDIQSLFLLENNEAAAPLVSPGSGMLMTTSNASICDDWDTMDMVNGRYTSTARHTLAPNGFFSVRSNATDEVIPRPGGMHNLTVDFNDDKSEKNVVLTVSLTTSSLRLRNEAHICFSSVGQGRGLSVYMPQALEMSDVLAFDVRLLFPRTHLVNSIDLVTYLPMFHQSFGYLAPKVPFEIINIAGAGVAIVCDHLSASKIAVKNSYAPISGSFNVTQSLTLDNIAG